MAQVIDAPSAAPSKRLEIPAFTESRPRWRAPFDALLAMLLFVVAVAVRWPYLWEVPRYTDELQEILWSLSIARGDILPLTAVDSYYGPLWSYLLAGLFALFGPSPELPRLVAMLLGAGLVILTYFFTRDLAGRWPAAIAAGLLATGGGHVVINSHTARSNSVTPLLTTLMLWLLHRSLATRHWDAGTGTLSVRRPEPRLLLLVGLLFGLALQTHVSVIALVPGMVIYLLWRGRWLMLTPWPYLAASAAALGYVNMLAYNLGTGFWSFRHARSLQAGYTDGRSTDLTYYLTNLGNLVQSLSRLLSSAIENADSPARVIYVGLTLFGLFALSRRGALLMALVAISVCLVLPYFNPRYGPILSGRYLVPLLPLGFAGIGCAVVLLARRLPTLGPSAWKPAALALGLALVLYPLFPLAKYYAEAVTDGRTNRPLHVLAGAIAENWEAGEIVLLDEGLAQEELGAGGTDLKAFRMLLGTRGIPYEIGKVSEADDYLADSGGGGLLLMEVKKRSSLPRTVSSTSIGSEVPSASGSEHRYGVYRVVTR